MGPQSGDKPKIDYKIPRPSASVVLISPKNHVLLLHRVKTSSSFPSAHVFPGGNISSQDGDYPPAGHPDSHDEGPHYRRAAIRELFEESGILLARNKATGQMLHVSVAEREKGRHAIHTNEITFDQWLKSQNHAAEPDIDPLVPFSHWITPMKNPRRFTTQMYLYFLPIAGEPGASLAEDLPTQETNEVQVPTSDGGLEITEAQFLPATEWLRRARANEIIMFPPQVLLLTFVAQYLEKADVNNLSTTSSSISVTAAESAKRRSELMDFVHSGTPPWTDKFISPRPIAFTPEGKTVLDLAYTGPELEGSDKQGEPDRVAVVKWDKAVPRDVEFRWRSEVILAKSQKSAL